MMPAAAETRAGGPSPLGPEPCRQAGGPCSQ
jgi:hypothetical protein